jgi:hypothetical protein
MKKFTKVFGLTAALLILAVACAKTPITTPLVTTQANITVATPIANNSVTSPFTLSGTARVFENQLNYRLTDSTNQLLAEGSIYANAPDMGQFGNYSTQISFTTTSTTGTLEVFDYSAKDGAEIDKVTIPVNFSSSATTSVKLFFNNNKLDPQITCTKVFAVTHSVTKTATIGQTTIEELLKGPTQSEKDQGYYTNINPGVTLKSLKITNGIAYADFDKKLDDKVGGSCRVGAIRSEITETLKQFPTIKSVVISVEGNSETSLQP